jgi:hypothetical protein
VINTAEPPQPSSTVLAYLRRHHARGLVVMTAAGWQEWSKTYFLSGICFSSFPLYKRLGQRFFLV